MKIEHFALMLEEPVAAAWYAKHFKMKIVTQSKVSPYAHFIADSTGDLLLEIFKLEDTPVPDYRNLDPNIFHLAFSVDNPANMVNILIDDGATLVDAAKKLPSGDQVAMLRDPWGLPIQLVHRKKPLI